MKILEHKFCIVCNSEKFSLEMNAKDFSVTKEEFAIYRCSKCRFVFTRNAPLETDIGKYYQSENYISHSDTKKGVVNKLYHLVRKIMLSRKYQLIKNLHTDKEILDIGCGTGYFLDYMKNKQYKTLGIEADKQAREYGKEKFHLEILTNEDLINGAVKTEFSIISLWHVLEHLYKPEYYMHIIHGLLKNDGYLIIALPNLNCFDARYYKSYWAGYDVPRHLWHFSPETIEIFARNNGFEIIEMKRLLFDSFYNSILSEEYRSNKLSIFSGGITGLISMVKSLFNIRNSSSIIYIMKKTASNTV
jgi:2-polyprenyl-3-methyl-5-hydroxy-6-metoxy-1,4-benzoquinol methylase